MIRSDTIRLNTTGSGALSLSLSHRHVLHHHRHAPQQLQPPSSPLSSSKHLPEHVSAATIKIHVLQAKAVLTSGYAQWDHWRSTMLHSSGFSSQTCVGGIPYRALFENTNMCVATHVPPHHVCLQKKRRGHALVHIMFACTVSGHTLRVRPGTCCRVIQTSHVARA